MSVATRPSELPTGTVTFLFTDVENSTGHVLELGEALRAGDRGTTAAWSGPRSTTTAGTRSTRAATSSSSCLRTGGDAVEAAIAIQRKHESYRWPGDRQVRVRIGIHTGRPTIEEDDYVGIDVHHVARLCSGGTAVRVPMSKAASMLSSDVPVDLGEHELKGLHAPERIFQLLRADAVSDFPALRLGNGLGLDLRQSRWGEARISRASSYGSRSRRTQCCSVRNGQAARMSRGSTSWVSRGRPRICCSRSAATRRTSSSSTSACPPHRPTRCCVGPHPREPSRRRRARPVAARRARLRAGALIRERRGVGYLLKDRSPTSTSSLRGSVARKPPRSILAGTQLVRRRRNRGALDDLTARERGGGSS